MGEPLDVAALPDPGLHLIKRVAGDTDRIAFYESGRDSVRELERTLSVVGRSVASFSAALDFGCGCGRMLFWLQDMAEGVDLHGTDIDAEAINWCRQNLTRARFAVNGAEPPTDYHDGQFDLVFNHSVFTHIDERLQDLWLAELMRITRPGALLVLSVHGEAAVPEGSWEIRDELQAHGFSYVDGSISPQLGLPGWYQNAWHAPWYVFQHWQRWFRIRAYIPGGALGLQDHVLLERLEGVPPRPLEVRSRRLRVQPENARVHLALDNLRRLSLPAAGELGAGSARERLRAMVLKLLRPYTFHQQRFNEAVAASLDELAEHQSPEDAQHPQIG